MVLRALFLRVSKPVFAKTRLSSDNGAEMRLVDADDAVGAAADILLEHHLLLLVHLECCLQALVILAAETRKKTARLFAQKIEKYRRRGNSPWIAPAPLTKYLSTTFRI